MMENNYIIHASGKVRIDRIDHLGIYNVDTGRHTHKLRVIKNYYKKKVINFIYHFLPLI